MVIAEMHVISSLPWLFLPPSHPRPRMFRKLPQPGAAHVHSLPTLFLQPRYPDGASFQNQTWCTDHAGENAQISAGSVGSGFIAQVNTD